MSKVKFIVTGDIHFKGTNPRGRLDSYQDAITRKIYEVFSLAQEHQAAAIIVPGDLFDSPGTALGTIADLAMVLQAAPCRVLAISGNHDLWSGNPGSKYRTPFGLLARLRLVWDLEQEPFECFTESGFKVAITGHGFTVDTDTEAGMGQFMPPPHAIPWRGESIHVVHSILLERSPGFEMRHTLIRDVKTTAQIVVSGHEHIGFGIHEGGNANLWINPGALCRLSAHPAEMDRTVQVALITVDDGKTFAELIPLQSARPGHEVLSRQHLEVEAEREDRISRFLGLLAAGGEMCFLETREIIEEIARRDNLPQAVVEEALTRVGKAREQLGNRAGVA